MVNPKRESWRFNLSTQVWYIHPKTFRCYKGYLSDDLKVIFKSKEMYRIYNSGKCKSIPISFNSGGVFGRASDAWYYQTGKLHNLLDSQRLWTAHSAPERISAVNSLRDAVYTAKGNGFFIDKKVLKDENVQKVIQTLLGKDEEEDDYDGDD